MTSNYSDIYSRFLSKIEDYDLAAMLESNANARMNEWLRSSLSKPNIRCIFSSISRDNEICRLEYEMTYPVDEEQDMDFVEELLSHQMCVEWLQPKVKNIKLINQMIFNTKEQKMYSQSAHMEQMRELLLDSKSEVDRLLSSRGFIHNTYLGDST